MTCRLSGEILTDQRDRFPEVGDDGPCAGTAGQSQFVHQQWRYLAPAPADDGDGLRPSRVEARLPADARGGRRHADRSPRRRARETGAIELEMAHVTADIIFRTVFSRPLTRDGSNSSMMPSARFQKEMFRYGKAAIIRMPKLFSFFTLRRAKTAAGEIRGHSIR